MDDPADFSLFFDTSGRRTCYIAPERFYAAGSEISKKKANLDFDKRDGKISEAMDVFSLGCVIAELFLEGAPMFTLSQLYKYRTGEFNVESHISSIEDEEVKVTYTLVLPWSHFLIIVFVELDTSHGGFRSC